MGILIIFYNFLEHPVDFVLSTRNFSDRCNFSIYPEKFALLDLLNRFSNLGWKFKRNLPLKINLIFCYFFSKNKSCQSPIIIFFAEKILDIQFFWNWVKAAKSKKLYLDVVCDLYFLFFYCMSHYYIKYIGV